MSLNRPALDVVSTHPRRRFAGVAAVAAAVLLLSNAFIATPSAHDIPADVLVQTIVRPSGDRLTILVRVPLAAMRDVSFPLHGASMLTLPVPSDLLRDAATLWIADAIEIDEDAARLAAPAIVSTRISLPSDRSFTSFDQAVAHLAAPPLGPDTEIAWNQALLDARFEYAIRSDRARFSMRPQFARLGLRVVTTVVFLPPSGASRAFEFEGDPGLVRLDPRWHQAAARFVSLGFRHILDGIDHLLFLLCLIIPVRRWRSLVLIVTSFTVAHSITLAASALDMAPDALWFPPLVETLIAGSIVYMALENIVVAGRPRGPEAAGTAASPARDPLDRRWAIAFAFGLVHGFGFSFALRQTLQFAGSHLLTSLVAFNVGIELGQLLVLLIAVPLLYAAFRYVLPERVGAIVVSALIAHTAWHWLTERASTLRAYDWTVAGSLQGWLRILAGALAAAGLAVMARAAWRARARRIESGREI
jgi:hypothetical protein